MRTNKNQEVIIGILLGDEKVMKAFYKKNLPYVRQFITKRGGSMEDVEDVFQDSLILIYHKLSNGSLELHVSIDTYFIGVCKNKWYNQFRKQQRIMYSDQMLSNTIINDNLITDTFTKQDQEYLYNKHYSKLPESSKTLLELFFDGKSMQEIGKITGYSEGNARKKKFEIKKLLTSWMQQDHLYAELA